MSSPGVSIIIVNWNGKRFLGACLKSVFSQTYRPFEVIVVDNGSSDGSADFVAKNFPKARLLRLGSNAGLAKANNFALEKAKGEFVVTLSNDTSVKPNWLGELVKPALLDAKIGMCASKSLRPGGKLIDSAGVVMYESGTVANRGALEKDAGQYGKEEEIFCPCGVSALYRKRALIDAGGFDEDYFLYFEDIDAGWRMRLAGWKAVFVPTSVLVHAHAASSGSFSDFQLYYAERNRYWTFFKNFSLSSIVRFLPALIASIFLQNVFWLLRGRLSVLKATMDAFFGLHRLLEKREAVQKTRRVSDSELARFFKPMDLLAMLSRAKKAFPYRERLGGR